MLSERRIPHSSPLNYLGIKPILATALFSLVAVSAPAAVTFTFNFVGGNTGFKDPSTGAARHAALAEAANIVGSLFGSYNANITLDVDSTNTENSTLAAFSKPREDVMKQIADDTFFELDSPRRALTLKNSRLRFTERSYSTGPNGTGGEEHALNHILRGHLDNDTSVGKSHFRKAEKLFIDIEDAWSRRGPGIFQPGPNGRPGRWRYDIDMSHMNPSIGSGGETRIRIVVEDVNGTPGFDIITTFPEP